MLPSGSRKLLLLAYRSFLSLFCLMLKWQQITYFRQDNNVINVTICAQNTGRQPYSLHTLYNMIKMINGKLSVNNHEYRFLNTLIRKKYCMRINLQEQRCPSPISSWPRCATAFAQNNSPPAQNKPAWPVSEPAGLPRRGRRLIETTDLLLRHTPCPLHGFASSDHLS